MLLPPGRTGPTFTSLSDLPAGPLTGIVVANELLDNLPFHLLEALKARSRVGEAAALTDPAGLGAFRVLEWQVG